MAVVAELCATGHGPCHVLEDNMDPRVHRRWLDYIEAYQYFREPGQQRLDRERFVALDAELEVLIERESNVGLDVEGRRRLVAIRHILLRD